MNGSVLKLTRAHELHLHWGGPKLFGLRLENAGNPPA